MNEDGFDQSSGYEKLMTTKYMVQRQIKFSIKRGKREKRNKERLSFKVSKEHVKNQKQPVQQRDVDK